MTQPPFPALLASNAIPHSTDTEALCAALKTALEAQYYRHGMIDEVPPQGQPIQPRNRLRELLDLVVDKGLHPTDSNKNVGPIGVAGRVLCEALCAVRDERLVHLYTPPLTQGCALRIPT